MSDEGVRSRTLGRIQPLGFGPGAGPIKNRSVQRFDGGDEDVECLVLSASVTLSIGVMRMTLPYRPPLPTSKPQSLANSSTADVVAASGSMLPGWQNSRPCMSPLPRSSATWGDASHTGARRSCICAPRAAALA